MVILAGDHVYKMDYELMLQQHVDSGADVTVACLEVSREEASAFGVMHVDETDRIVDFVEKPADPPSTPAIRACRWRRWASMSSAPPSCSSSCAAMPKRRAPPATSARTSSPIWSNMAKPRHTASPPAASDPRTNPAPMGDVGTVDAYWEASLDLTDVVPQLDLYDRSWPLWTYAEITPPAKFVHDVEGRRGSAVASLIAGDCIVSGSSINRSLLSTGVRTHSYASLNEAVVLPFCQIGRGAQLRRVILDRGVRFPTAWWSGKTRCSTRIGSGAPTRASA